jgi:hypothetical protein
VQDVSDPANDEDGKPTRTKRKRATAELPPVGVPELLDRAVTKAVALVGERRHGLSDWHRGEDFVVAECLACGAWVQVVVAVEKLDATITGPALYVWCQEAPYSAFPRPKDGDTYECSVGVHQSGRSLMWFETHIQCSDPDTAPDAATRQTRLAQRVAWDQFWSKFLGDCLVDIAKNRPVEERPADELRAELLRLLDVGTKRGAQLAGIQRHSVGAWESGADARATTCLRCGAPVQVSIDQTDKGVIVRGPALYVRCQDAKPTSWPEPTVGDVIGCWYYTSPKANGESHEWTVRYRGPEPGLFARLYAKLLSAESIRI